MCEQLALGLKEKMDNLGNPLIHFPAGGGDSYPWKQRGQAKINLLAVTSYLPIDI